MEKKRTLLIVIDLGNTTVSFGVYVGSRLWHSGCLPVNDIPLLGRKLSISGTKYKSISCTICSVNPKMTGFVRKSVKNSVGQQKVHFYEVGKEVCPRLPSRYAHQQVGHDRIVNAYGACRRYGSPVLVLDFGTALTVDYVSKGGVYEGGLIIPGAEVALEGLLARAALLPKTLKIKRRQSLIGRNTEDSISLGVLNGYGCLADGLIERFRKRYGRRLKAVATGGFAKQIAPYSRLLDVVDPTHTLRSLALIFHCEVGRE